MSSKSSKLSTISKLLKPVTLLFFTVFFVGFAVAETCTAKYTVTYDCGAGTVAGTLPADATATYGTSFYPTMLTTSHCQAPDGYHQVGIEIWDEDSSIGGYASTAPAFKYYYTSGITIKPHYVQDGTDGAAVWNLRGTNGSSVSANNSTMTWSVSFSNYGMISGIAACSKVEPQNNVTGTVTGFIPDDQDAIKNEGGGYCYCKMTEPFFADSKWVYQGHPTDSYYHSSNCPSACASVCRSDIAGKAILRASIFRGARPY